MAWVAVGVSAVGAYSGYKNSKRQAKSARAAADAAKFRPYTVEGFGGNSAIFDEEEGSVTLQGGAQQDISNLFGLEALQRTLGDNMEGQLGGQLSAGGAGLLPGAFAQQQSFQGRTPEEAFMLEQRFGQQAGLQQQLGTQGLQAAFGGQGSGQALAERMGARGESLLDGGNFNALAAQRLTALREGARPSEDRAVDSKLGNLFSSGRLGTTGGSRAIGELSLQQELADQSRIMQSQNFAQQQSNYERQLGSNLTGQAFSGFGQEAQRLAQQGQLGANLIQGAGRSTSAQLGALQVGDQAGASRVDRRLSSAQNMFGFGQKVEQSEMDKTLQLIGGQQSIQGGILDLAKLGGSVGQMQAAAGANAGTLAVGAGGSPGFAALQGLATGALNSGVDFGSLFSGAGTPGGGTPDYSNAEINLPTELKF